jgi:hypothetical protein
VARWYLPHELPTDDLLVLGGDSVSARPVADLAHAVADALAGNPRFAPTRASRNEPVRALRDRSLREAVDVELQRSGEGPLRLLFGGAGELHGWLVIFPDPMLDRSPRTHTIDAGVPLAPLDADGVVAFAGWALDLFDALGVFHGYVTTAEMQAQRKAMISEAYERGEMAGSRWDDPLYTVLDRMVSDVYWVNYFGPAFVDRWGSTRFEGLGVRQAARPTGAIAIWATETPPVVEPGYRRLGDYVFKRPFYDAFGTRSFTRESLDLPEPGEVVPTLHEHRRRSLR